MEERFNRTPEPSSGADRKGNNKLSLREENERLRKHIEESNRIQIQERNNLKDMLAAKTDVAKCLNKNYELLEKEKSKLIKSLKYYRDNDIENKKWKDQFDKMQETWLQVSTENDKLSQNVNSLKDELQDTKSRLSKMMSAKVLDNNPDIADLSDVNRPNKLAEKYQELYDNQWSDAFEALVKSSTKPEKENVEYLLRLLTSARQFCEIEAQQQTMHLEEALFTVKSTRSLPDTVRKQIKDIRKSMVQVNSDFVYQRFVETLHSNGQYTEADIVPYL